MKRTHIAIAVAVAAVVSCSGAAADTIVVSAAASLGDPFTTLAESFEAEHPDVDVVLNLAGSSTLREQLVAGAPVDVVAVANEAIMQDLVEAGVVVGVGATFATNRLVLGVPSGNPAGVETLADLEKSQLLVGLCAAPVPCGSLARAALDAAGIAAAVDSEEPDARALATKLALGELDAALVYATDANRTSEIETVETGLDVATSYVIALVADAGEAELAQLFIDHVLSASGADVLSRAGFGRP